MFTTSYGPHSITLLSFINLTLNELSLIKKVNLKAVVKEACKKSALKYLLNEIKRKDMSKVKSLQYKKLQMQPYLSSNGISLKRKIILFKARTRMLNVKWNFGEKILCPLCKIGDDKQEHLLNCILIKLRSPSLFENKNRCEYSDIFSSNLTKLNNVAELLHQAIRVR